MKKVIIILLFGLLMCAELFSQVFNQQEINDDVYARIAGKSFSDGCPVQRSDLRYLQVWHYDAKGEVHLGELICHKRISNDLLEIFRLLYEAQYPIERMVLVDEYNADDEASMQDNNTSAFNFRRITGSKTLSRHAYGMAVDINPLYNPFVRTRKGRVLISPSNAQEYTDRTKDFHYKIMKGDICYRLFKKYGFSWGGDWKNSKDYQHFEKR